MNFTLFGSCLSHDLVYAIQKFLGNEVGIKYAFRIPFAYFNNQIIEFGEEQEKNLSKISDESDHKNYQEYFKALNVDKLLNTDYVIVDLVKETYFLQKFGNKIALYGPEYSKYDLECKNLLLSSDSVEHFNLFKNGLNVFREIFKEKKIYFIYFNGGIKEGLDDNATFLKKLSALNEYFASNVNEARIIDMREHIDMVDLSHPYGPSCLHMSTQFWDIAAKKFMYDLY